MDPNPLATALREVEEESGLLAVPLSCNIFDIDKHVVPEGLSEPSHFHYDVRFLLEADEHLALTQSKESVGLRWLDLEEVQHVTTEPSIAKMVAKHKRQLLDTV